MRLARLAKGAHPRCLTVAGGPHATHLAHHLLKHYPQIDLVVRGEGEETMLDLVRAHGRGEIPAALGAIRGISFRDAEGRATVNKQRVIDFCRGLIESGTDLLWDCQSRVNAVDEERLVWMRRAGCTHIQYGVESGSPRMLLRLNKGITIDQVRAAAAATRRVG